MGLPNYPKYPALGEKAYIKPTKIDGIVGLKFKCPKLVETVELETPFIYLDVDLDIMIENCLCGDKHYLELSDLMQ